MTVRGGSAGVFAPTPIRRSEVCRFEPPRQAPMQGDGTFSALLGLQHTRCGVARDCRQPVRKLWTVAGFANEAKQRVAIHHWSIAHKIGFFERCTAFDGGHSIPRAPVQYRSVKPVDRYAWSACTPPHTGLATSSRRVVVATHGRVSPGAGGTRSAVTSEEGPWASSQSCSPGGRATP